MRAPTGMSKRCSFIQSRFFFSDDYTSLPLLKFSLPKMYSDTYFSFVVEGQDLNAGGTMASTMRIRGSQFNAEYLASPC